VGGFTPPINTVDGESLQGTQIEDLGVGRLQSVHSYVLLILTVSGSPPTPMRASTPGPSPPGATSQAGQVSASSDGDEHKDDVVPGLKRIPSSFGVTLGGAPVSNALPATVGIPLTPPGTLTPDSTVVTVPPPPPQASIPKTSSTSLSVFEQVSDECNGWHVVYIFHTAKCHCVGDGGGPSRVLSRASTLRASVGEES